MPGFPRKVFESYGRIDLYNNNLQCGLISLLLPDMNVPCFFTRDRFSVQPYKGAKLLVNAWLVNPESLVPYLAACCWKEENAFLPTTSTLHLFSSIFCRLTHEDDLYHCYMKYAHCLTQSEFRGNQHYNDEMVRTIEGQNVIKWSQETVEVGSGNIKFLAANEEIKSLTRKLSDHHEKNTGDLRNWSEAGEKISRYDGRWSDGYEKSLTPSWSDVRGENRSSNRNRWSDVREENLSNRWSGICEEIRSTDKGWSNVQEDNFTIDRKRSDVSDGNNDATGRRWPDVKKENLESTDSRFSNLCDEKNTMKRKMSDCKEQTVDQRIHWLDEKGVFPKKIKMSNNCKESVKTPISKLFENKIGRVLKILDDNYGVGITSIQNEMVYFIFDVHDLWIKTDVCALLKKSLKEVLQVGDWLKVTALMIHVPRIENSSKSKWNFKMMATSVISGKSFEAVKLDKLVPDQVKTIHDVHPEKIRNFQTVVTHVSKNIVLSNQEKQIIKEYEDGSGLHENWTSLPISDQYLTSKQGIVIEVKSRFSKKELEHFLERTNLSIAIIRFSVEVYNEDEKKLIKKDLHALYHSMTRKCVLTSGMTVTFNAIFMGHEKKSYEMFPVSHFVTSFYISDIDGSLRDSNQYREAIDKAASNEVYDTRLCSIFKKNKSMIKTLLNICSSSFKYRNRGPLLFTCPTNLNNVPGHLIYSTSAFALVQVDIGNETYFGLYMNCTKLCQSQVSNEERETHVLASAASLPYQTSLVKVNCSLIQPLCKIQYLVTGLWYGEVQTPPIPIHTTELFPNVVVKFHNYFQYTIHLPQLHSPFLANLGQRDFQTFIKIFQQLIEEPLFELSKLAFTTIKGVKLNTALIKSIIQTIGDNCLSTKDINNCKIRNVNIDPEQVQHIVSTGVRSMRSLEMLTEDEVYNWICSFLDPDLDCLPGPVQGWGVIEDSQLILLALKNEFNWNCIIEQADGRLKKMLTIEDDRINEQIVNRFLKICNTWIFPFLGSNRRNNNNFV